MGNSMIKPGIGFKHHAKLMGLDDLTASDASEKLSSRLWRRYGATAFRLLEMIQEDPCQAEVLIKEPNISVVNSRKPLSGKWLRNFRTF